MNFPGAAGNTGNCRTYGTNRSSRTTRTPRKSCHTFLSLVCSIFWIKPPFSNIIFSSIRAYYRHIDTSPLLYFVRSTFTIIRFRKYASKYWKTLRLHACYKFLIFFCLLTLIAIQFPPLFLFIGPSRTPWTNV